MCVPLQLTSPQLVSRFKCVFVSLFESVLCVLAALMWKLHDICEPSLLPLLLCNLNEGMVAMAKPVAVVAAAVDVRVPV